MHEWHLPAVCATPYMRHSLYAPRPTCATPYMPHALYMRHTLYAPHICKAHQPKLRSQLSICGEEISGSQAIYGYTCSLLNYKWLHKDGTRTIETQRRVCVCVCVCVCVLPLCGIWEHLPHHNRPAVTAVRNMRTLRNFKFKKIKA